MRGLCFAPPTAYNSLFPLPRKRDPRLLESQENGMNPRLLLAAATLVTLTVSGPGISRAALTIDQAETISKRTGRPILAVAGSST